MKIHNLRQTVDPSVKENAAIAARVDRTTNDSAGTTPIEIDRQALEIAMLKARIQHLELLVETARSLMGTNQERLLRQLHDVPRDMMAIGAQLRRLDPQSNN